MNSFFEFWKVQIEISVNDGRITLDTSYFVNITTYIFFSVTIGTYQVNFVYTEVVIDELNWPTSPVLVSF